MEEAAVLSHDGRSCAASLYDLLNEVAAEEGSAVQIKGHGVAFLSRKEYEDKDHRNGDKFNSKKYSELDLLLHALVFLFVGL